jgi:two-component sensor histidine kinase
MKRKENKTKHLKFLGPLISVAFWLLMFMSPLLFGNFEDGIDWEHILKTWRSFIPYLALFLINRFVFLPFFFFRGKRWFYFICNVALIMAMAIGVHFYRSNVLEPQIRDKHREAMAPLREGPSGHMPPPPGERPPMFRENRPPKQGPPIQLPPMISFIVVSFLIIGFDTGLMISVKWAQSEQKRVRAEKESMESQLAFLQNQVSPHFFMNTLNNIHSLIDIDTSEAKESIIKLSKLMRHLLYDSQVERISLRKEIEFIQNYVELMRLRFSDKVKIDLHTPTKLPDTSIPPLLFTSFVENAFKHGISYQEKSFIDIRFSFQANQLYFTIRNSNPGVKKEEGPSGIGIENSRKRLNLIYGDSYVLDIEESKKEFTLSLYIPI